MFDESVINESDKDAVLSVFDKCGLLLNALDNELSIDELNNITGSWCTWNQPVKTQSLSNSIELLKQLINETYSYTNHYVCYVGFPAVEGDDIL
jgi:hypothetical protein